MNKKNASKKDNSGSIIFIVEAIIKTPKGILLLKRSGNNKAFVGKWQLPGGKMDEGETPVVALRREVFEETGKKCSSVKLLREVKLGGNYYGKACVFIINVFSCKIREPVRLSPDHAESGFFNLKTLDCSILTEVSKKALFG